MGAGIETFDRFKGTSSAVVVARLRGFWRDETGTLVIFALMLAMLMMMMGGIAVDVMRYESRRTSLQNTLDRSTLAAAALNQAMTPRAVVDDYFLKAGLSTYLTSVTVTQGMNFREVAATAQADTNPLFLHLMGIDHFDANSASAAEQRVNKVEIMLVLDVSGSMAQNSKIANLRTAADAFVSTVLTGDTEKKISIGIVPFNGQINLGTTLAAQYKTIDPSGATDVNCVDLPAAAYNSSSLANYGLATSATPLSLPMTSNADTFDGTSQSTSFVATNNTSYATPVAANLWCPPKPGNIVRLPSQSITDLQADINGLTAVGATSINAGMKWGLDLLDPATRPTFDALINAGSMSADLTSRPFDYTDHDAMKVIVLMTDGENYAEERVNDPYKDGLSPIYQSSTDGNYSIFQSSVAAPNQYYVPHLGTWQSTPWNGTGTAVQKTWQQVWANLRVSYVAWQMYARPLGGASSSLRSSIYTSQMAAMKTLTVTTDMDTQMQGVCTMAKNNGVIVYGIAFEAPTNGQTQIRNCSTDPVAGSHYFNASGLAISTAFAAIADNISQLRLTQ